MVKIAIAGASSQLAREVLDKLVETGKHEIFAMVRKDPSLFPALPGVQWVQTNFEDQVEIAQRLQGVHTVLCFFLSTQPDPDAQLEKRLINAAVEAGVKRYASSEWQMGAKLADAIKAVPWYAGKIAIRAYLKEINQTEKVLEYTLFQPGHYMEYLVAPHNPNRHVTVFPTFFDLEQMRAILDESSKDTTICYSAICDIAGVVACAVEYEGKWPEVGGFAGSRIKISDLIKLIEKIRGKPLTIDWVDEKDYMNGDLKSDLRPPINHPAVANISKEELDGFAKASIVGLLLGLKCGAWSVTDEWNLLLPDYKFIKLEDYVEEAWGNK